MRIERRKPLSAHIGLFCVGHHTYWRQYQGLREELLGYHDIFKKRIESHGVSVTDFGMVDEAESAYRVMKGLKAGNFDLIFCNMVTYATSSTWGVIVREVDVPIVLVGLQPARSFDMKTYTTHIQLANDQLTALPEFAGVSVRMGKKPPPYILGTLFDDQKAEAEVAEWVSIARVLHDLRTARIGQMGHTLEAMLDMNSDPTMFTAAFGLHVVATEPHDVLRQMGKVTKEEIAAKRRLIEEFFDTPDPVSDPDTLRLTEEDLNIAAQVACALDRFIEEKHLDGLAYYYEGTEGSEIRSLVESFIVGNSLLCAAGFPMCGENDLKTCVAMLIMDRLDIGGSFAEFHPMNFERNVVYVGHDGPHHLNICHGKPVLRSLLKYHGKPGKGASVEFKIKEGPLTLFGITQTAAGKFKFVIGEGLSVPGPIPPTGNTNTPTFFEPDPLTYLKAWCDEGPTHHFGLGVGHHAKTIKKIGEVLGIESVIVKPTQPR